MHERLIAFSIANDRRKEVVPVMKTMRKLYDQTMCKLDEVMEYSKCAMSYKELDPDLSKLYSNMAKTEMDLAKSLHSMSQKKANSKMGEKDSIDSRLMELWEEMEDVKMEKMAQAKALLDLATG